jgi:Flp pilus assembly protein TadD
MTLIGNLQPHLAGAADLKTFQPTWMPVAHDWVGGVEEQLPGYLLRARAAVKAHPHVALAHARLAQAAQADGRGEEAIKAARRALELALGESDQASVYAAMAVLETEGRGSELAPLLDDRRSERLSVNIRLRAAIAAGDHAAAISVLSDPQSVGRVSPDALSLLTWVYLQRREFPQAVAAGRRAQAAGATGTTLYANLGYAHAALGQLAKAIKLTRQAHALAPLHRGVGLNLALYLKLAGDHEGALALLEQLRVGDRTDVQLALAMANVEVYAGETEKARRLLQRIRASSEWALAGDRRRAELEANLALLRWKTGTANAHTTITSMRRALSATDYESLSIAYLLANVLMRCEHAPLLAGVIDRLQTRHDPRELEGLRMVQALLEHDGATAVELARSWAAREILNPNAATLATYLVADLDGDFDEAARIGLNGLSRAPSHMMLINNTAYSLALAGRAEQAKKLLERLNPSCERVELIATRALVDMSLGHVTRGLEGYNRAWGRAMADRDKPLADLVAANALLARLRAGLETVLDHALLDRLAKAADARPGYWVVSQRLQRELAIQTSMAQESNRPHSARIEDAMHTCPLDLHSVDSTPPWRRLSPRSDS